MESLQHYIDLGGNVFCTVAIDFSRNMSVGTTNRALMQLCIKEIVTFTQPYVQNKFEFLGFGLPAYEKTYMVLKDKDPNRGPLMPKLMNNCPKDLHDRGAYFAPVVQHVAERAKRVVNGIEYHLLVVLTYGSINDMQDTLQTVVDNSGLPMSIILIGLGDGEFEAMNVLDGDEIRVSYKGTKAARDIIQFVPLYNFITGDGTDKRLDRKAFENALLEELPEQINCFMIVHNINHNDIVSPGRM